MGVDCFFSVEKDDALTDFARTPGFSGCADRLAFEAIAQGCPLGPGLPLQAEISEIVAVLEAHSWPVFRRLALHLLDSTAAEATDLIDVRSRIT